MGAQQKRIADVHVRWLIRRDMPEVIEIENRSFELPWKEDDFFLFLRQSNNIGCVAENATYDHVYGFMTYGLYKQKLILSKFAVAPEVRRTGVGRAMVERLIEKLSQQRRQVITTQVPESNLQAQMFFSKCGFTATGHNDGTIAFQYVLKGCFPDWQGVNRIANLDRRKW